MEFFEYWARRKVEIQTDRGPRTVGAVGWSNESQASADAMADERLEAAQRRVKQAEGPSGHGYPYSDGRPVQEQIVDTVPGVEQPLAVITRNAYGALVMNTRRLLFIDLDFESVPDQRSLFKKLLSGSRSDEERALDHAQQVAKRYSDWGFRVYRTAAGLRLVLLSRVVDAEDDTWLRVLETFGSDPMYIKLCQSQKSFRARLTPKPWRIGVERPSYRFPFVSDVQREYMARWTERYDSARIKHATCRELTTIGADGVQSGFAPSEVTRLLDYHDRIAQSASLPLA